MIQRDSVIPIYFQIQQILRHRIASGELRPGDRVESERELAKKYKHQLDDGPSGASGA
jgi:GntR family transcriptional regulator